VDMHEAAEAAEIRKELESLAPGVLDKLREGEAGTVWYEDIQKSLRKEAAASAKARQAAAAAAAASLTAGPGSSTASVGEQPGAAAPSASGGPSVTGGLGGLFSEVKGVKDGEGTGGGGSPQYLTQRPPRRKE
jgi:hypothetical protein